MNEACNVPTLDEVCHHKLVHVHLLMRGSERNSRKMEGGIAKQAERPTG
jgi:hypothetical protein